MTNTALLKAKIIECGLSQSEVAAMIGISYQAFNNKLHNKVDFKASEIEALCRVLNISDKNTYFFCLTNSQNG